MQNPVCAFEKFVKLKILVVAQRIRLIKNKSKKDTISKHPFFLLSWYGNSALR